MIKDPLVNIIDLGVYSTDGLVSGVTELDVCELETYTCLKMPFMYSKYLIEYGTFPNSFKKNVVFQSKEKTFLTGDDGRDELLVFYGIKGSNNLITEMYDDYGDILPDGFLPIAGLPGGSHLCICCSGDQSGMIFFVGMNPMNGNMVEIKIVADNFFDLINRMTFEENAEIDNLDDVLIEEKWNI